MAIGLDVNDIVAVDVSFTNTGAGYRNFGACLLLGSSNVIDVVERKRQYADLTEMAADFGTTVPEYQFAKLFFSQSPKPDLLYVGRWAQTATAAILNGASLTPAQRLLTLFTAVTAGAMRISVDGTLRSLSALNFSGAVNLNGVASIIQAALIAAGSAGSQVIWDATNLRFKVVSGTTGAASSVSYASAPTAGTDISVLLGLSILPTSSGANANTPIAGVAPESLSSCVSLFDAYYGDWYALGIATATPPSDADHIAVASYVEGLSRNRIYGISSQNTTLYDVTRSDDLASILSSSRFSRTLIDFSTTTSYPFASLFALFATIQYTGSNTTITAKFKQMPGVIPESLTETEAATLDAKHVNYYVTYQNDVAIVQQGVMCDGTFIDARINADWLANFVQTNAFNVLVALPKVPQTDAGMNLLKASMSQSLIQGVTNGFLAPGVWNGPSFGTLQTGDFLPAGFYIYAPLVASQSETDRAARKSVPFQIAAKEAGAVHSCNIQITVNP